MKNRREFLKKSALTLATTGVLASGVALAKETGRKDLVKGESKKAEPLFKRSANWQQYYEKAE